MNRNRVYVNRLVSAVLVLTLVLSMTLSLGSPVLAAPMAQNGASVFINELHYDNTGGDTGEAIEIAGPAGTDLSGWTVSLYNGSASQLNVYDTINLTGDIPDQQNGFGTLFFATEGIQNGSPDGLALVDAANNVVQFLSYEGTFTAINGPAAGMPSTDIGVSEGSGTLIGDSLQLVGSGTEYGDFAWSAPSVSSFGAINAGQTFGTAMPSLVINEIDYDQPSTDTAEFIEIKSNEPGDVDLGAYSLQLVNGTSGGASEYKMIALPAVILAPGDYFVVCANAATTENCDLDESPDTNLIQNGAPDAVALLLDSDIIDTVSYEGDTGAPYTEGSGVGLVDDASTADRGISRCPDGTDANQNDTDFSYSTITPGAANDCPVAIPVAINEIRIDQPSTDNDEYFELIGEPGTSLDGLTHLVIGDGTGGSGVIESVVDLTGSAIPASGYFVAAEGTFTLGSADLTTRLNFENSDNVTHMLVSGFAGSNGADLDTDDDGVLDVEPWTAIADSVALVETVGSGDKIYSDTTVGPDGSYVPGHVYRCDAGWKIGPFSGGGDTPSAENPCDIGLCGDPATLIHSVQGSGSESPLNGTPGVVIEGVVVGDFQDTSTALRGFFLQEEDGDADSDPSTSEGIFVFDNGFGVDVEEGQVVRVLGTVTEYFDLTELGGVSKVLVCGTGTATAATVTLPLPAVDDWEITWEFTEGMLVTIPQTLYATDNYNQGRYGEVTLSVNDRLDNPTNVVEPGAPAQALQDLNNRSQIQLDDGSTVQNPLPLPPYLGVDNTLRAGDTIPSLTGVLGYAFGVYEIHPTGALDFTRVNARSTTPDVGGSIKVAGFNVLNYFTTLDNSGPICGPDGDQDCRGADNAFEFERQRDKIIAAITEMDADVVGLIELENHPGDVPISDLVSGLNDVLGASTYDYIATGAIGSDAIRVGLIYQPSSVTPVGSYAVLDSSVDARFIDTLNRPVLAQTFQEIGTDDLVMVAVNHLKSKGSNCNDVGDPDIGDGQGNCNLTRTAAAEALVDWLATDPTVSGSTDSLIIGDLNAYAKEDPVDVIVGAGYANLVETFEGVDAYSYVFFGQAGYLDHGLSTPSLTSRVTGAGVWHINADEPSALDYNNYNQPALYSPDPFRASDHDPVVVGICETTPPIVDIAVTPDLLWPANHKYVDVTAEVTVIDADPDVVLMLESVSSNEPDNGEDDGDTVDDIVIVDDFNFQLRAERSGIGTGRVYIITYQVTDACGNTTIATTTVTVPLSRGK